MTLRAIIISCFLIICSNTISAQVENVNIEFDRISDNVLIVWGGKIYKDQIAAIKTDKGIVLIDAGKAPSLAKEYRKIIEREFNSSNFIYVIDTHYHYDHSSGNQVFPEAEIIAHETSAAGMKNFAANINNFVSERRSGNMIQWKNQIANAEPGSIQYIRLNDYLTTGEVMLNDYENNYVMTLPTITFRDKMTLDLGNLTLHLYYWGQGMHTGDDILIQCPEEELLFSGDLFYNQSFGFAFSTNFDLERWISILDEVFENGKVKWDYDCHNSRMTGEFIALYHRYMKDIFNNLSKAKSGNLTMEEALNTCILDEEFSYIFDSGIDPATLRRNHFTNLKLTWYKLMEYRSGANLLMSQLQSESIESAIESIKNARKQKDANLYFDEGEFNRIGYQLMGSGRIEEAVDVFKLNVELFPESANTYDSLGEAYFNSGDNVKSLYNYKKSLELNPDNNNAASMIERISNQK